MPWLSDLKWILDDEEDVASLGSTLFLSSQAKIPKLASGEFALSVVDTGGTNPEGVHNITIRPGYLNTSAQVVARASTYQAAYAKAQEAWDALYPIRNRFVGSGDVQPWYMWISMSQNPGELGVDGVGNVRVGFNITGRMRP